MLTQICNLHLMTTILIYKDFTYTYGKTHEWVRQHSMFYDFYITDKLTSIFFFPEIHKMYAHSIWQDSFPFSCFLLAFTYHFISHSGWYKSLETLFWDIDTLSLDLTRTIQLNSELLLGYFEFKIQSFKMKLEFDKKCRYYMQIWTKLGVFLLLLWLRHDSTMWKT